MSSGYLWFERGTWVMGGGGRSEKRYRDCQGRERVPSLRNGGNSINCNE